MKWISVLLFGAAACIGASTPFDRHEQLMRLHSRRFEHSLF
jgi:hypothetical protein